VVAPAPETRPANGNGHAHLQVALAIRTLRQRAGISQRQLAMRMNVPRTYVSKIENDKATPTLSSLQRLANALGVGVPDLLKGGIRTREEEVRELVADDFIAQIVPFIGKLNGMQWSSLLGQIRDMTLRPRRTS
jgi:transcriptional regulator with XRE-family HTH domain